MGPEAEKISERAVRKALLASAALLALVLFLPVMINLARQWLDDPNYRHGLVIPVVIILLIRNKWTRIINHSPYRSSPMAGYLLIALSAVMIIGGTAASELFSSRLSLVLFIIGTTLLLAGPALLKILAAESLLLFLMIPLPYIIYYRLTFPLQLLSARLSAAILRTVQLNVIRKGNIIALPRYTLEVVAACSGLRSLLTMVTLAVIIAAISSYSTGRKIILVASSIPVAVAANTFRLVVTALGAYLASPAFADGVLHQISGLMVFGSGLIMLLIINGVLKWKR
ncbi:MAG: exosortase [Candidatus Latescibacteria bacterium]|nr:exosortase [bacterium]MBD3424179.1 exosortase [Candidatus Latescibacterota bacterium]